MSADTFGPAGLPPLTLPDGQVLNLTTGHIAPERLQPEPGPGLVALPADTFHAFTRCLDEQLERFPDEVEFLVECASPIGIGSDLASYLRSFVTELRNALADVLAIHQSSPSVVGSTVAPVDASADTVRDGPGSSPSGAPGHPSGDAS